MDDCVKKEISYIISSALDEAIYTHRLNSIQEVQAS